MNKVVIFAAITDFTNECSTDSVVDVNDIENMIQEDENSEVNHIKSLEQTEDSDWNVSQ